MKYPSNTTGYSLVEALVAISILLVAIVGPMTIASQGIKSSAFALEQNTAFFLAQEGIETMFALRGDYLLDENLNGSSAPDSWSWLENELTGSGPCLSNWDTPEYKCSFGVSMNGGNVTFSNNNCEGNNVANCLLYYNESGSNPNVYTHTATGGTPSEFTRVITVERLNDHSVSVSSAVTWQSRVFVGVSQKVVLDTALFDLLP